MSQRFFSLLSMGAVAFCTNLPGAIAQTPPPPGHGILKMVMVDQAQLSTSERSAFQQFLRTANLPRTKVGQRCQYYGKPQVWCLLLDSGVAEQVYQQLSRQPVFGPKAEIKTVRPLRPAERN